MSEIRDGRPRPHICFNCKGKRVVPHCPRNTGACCFWVRCKECQAVSGYKHSKDAQGSFAGWKRISYSIPSAA